MKISVSKEDLLNGLQSVQNVVGTRSTLPILSNVLLIATEDRIELRATDLEVSIHASVPATVERAGASTLPARRIYGLVREIEATEIAIEISDIDLDGDMDIITGGYYGNITFYENISITPNNINNYNNLSLEIFPNPTYDKLNLSDINNLSLVEITDQIGKKIKSISTPKQSIDVSDLENGVYFIELIYKNQKKIRRFIKK